MTDIQATIALASIPNVLAVMLGILINNVRLSDTNSRIGDIHARIGETNARIGELRGHMDQRLDDMKEMWRSELHRVGEILDARLKHLEQR
jgi:hypothetical protein